MVDVSYDQELEYLRDSERGKPFPGLWIVLSGMDHERELEVMAHLDSGTETSLFDGQIGRAIGLDLSSAEILVFRSSTGGELAARLHAVRLGSRQARRTRFDDSLQRTPYHTKPTRPGLL